MLTPTYLFWKFVRSTTSNRKNLNIVEVHKFLFTLEFIKDCVKRHIQGSVSSDQSDGSADTLSRLKLAKINIKEFDEREKNLNASLLMR